MNKKLIIILFFTSLFSTFAENSILGNLDLQVKGAYYPFNDKNANGSGFAIPFKSVYEGDFGGFEGAVDLVYSNFIYLLNNPDSILFKNNGVEVLATFHISPVTSALKGDVNLTPIAFFNINTSLELGLAWPMGDFSGIGVVLDDKYTLTTGTFIDYKMGARLQFSLNSIIEGDWSNLIFVAGSNLEYLYNPQAREGQPWILKNDSGTNLNGLSIAPYFLLAYQLPLPLKVVGILTNFKTRLGSNREVSPISKNGWGSDFLHSNISLLSSIDILENLNLAFQLKFSNNVQYKGDTFKNIDPNKRESTGGSYFSFKSIGLSLNYRIL